MQITDELDFHTTVYFRKYTFNIDDMKTDRTSLLSFQSDQTRGKLSSGPGWLDINNINLEHVARIIENFGGRTGSQILHYRCQGNLLLVRNMSCNHDWPQWSKRIWLKYYNIATNISNYLITGGGTDTRAVRQPDGTYKLYGYKWFSSATDADVTLTLARIVSNDGEITKVSHTSAWWHI